MELKSLITGKQRRSTSGYGCPQPSTRWSKGDLSSYVAAAAPCLLPYARKRKEPSSWGACP